MAEDELRRIFELGKKLVAAAYDGSTYHMSIIGFGDGVVMPAMLLWDHPSERAAMIDQLRAEFAKRGVDRFVAATEMWMVKVPVSMDTKIIDQKALLGGVQPRDHKDRVECILVHAEDKSGRAIIGQYSIIRDGKTGRLGDFDEWSAQHVQLKGMFASLLGGKSLLH